jgi:flagellar biosynthesis protein FlhB
LAEGGDRTEKATPKRREEARRRGQVARSQEIGSALVLLTGVSLLLMAGGHLSRVLGRNAVYLFGQAHVLRPDDPGGLQVLLGGNLQVMATALAPLLLAVLLAGLAAGVAQVGFHVSAEALSFKLEKMNPLNGLKRMLGKRSAFELIKTLLKVGLVALIAWLTVRGELKEILSLTDLPLPVAVAVGKASFAELMYKLLALVAILAVLDWTFQRSQHEQNLKMTRSEVKQEMRDLDGDPQVKARVRAIQYETARRRMLTDVPQADVVVTNPDHFAVALRYDRAEGAPRVLAKGRNLVAQTIKEIARRHRVPVLENRPLARALYRQAKVGGFVPEGLYQAVAEVLAYVYRLRRG